MPKIFATLLSLFFLTVFNAHAQQGIIKGTAVDATTRKGLEFATVSLLSARDSSIVNSVFTDASGLFQLTSLKEGSYLLTISSIEYSRKYVGPLKIGAGEVITDIGEIPMLINNQTLQEVKVTGQAPMFRNKANGTVEVNVANTILATASSAMEILSRSPAVNVTEDGIFVLGKGEAIIYLNGRRITLEQLSSISASQIKKVEIIANPSSRYDAEGKAVINVITSGNTEDGYKGSIRQMLTVSDFCPPSGNTYFDLNYKKNKLSLTGSYSLLAGSGKEILYTTRSRSKDGFESVLITDWNRKYRNFSTYNLGGQYDIDEKSYLSAEYSGAYNQLGGNTLSENAIRSASIEGLFKSDVVNNNVLKNRSLTLNYNRNPGKSGSSLFIGGQYARYLSVTDDAIHETNRLEEITTPRVLNNKAGYDIQLANIQVDFTRALDSRHKLDAGLKYSRASNSSYSDFFIAKEGQGFVPDNTRSANFRYTESIPAAYLNFNGDLNKKLAYSIGIRSEFTDYVLETDVEGFEQIKDHYLSFFPNALFSYKASEQFQISFSYTSRIGRPRYQSLNPSGIYQDAYTSIEGNPFLTPEKTNAFELGATYKAWGFKTGYSFTGNAIAGGAVQGKDENSYVLKPLNFSSLTSLYASLSVPVLYKGWSSMNNIDLTYNSYRSIYFTNELNPGRPQLHVYSSNSYAVNKLFKIQALGRFTGNRYDGLFYRHHQLLLALGIEKEFFNKALKLNFTANDIFRTDKPSGDYEIAQTYIIFARKNNNKHYRLTLTYNFGGLKKVSYRNKSTGQIENSRAQ